MPSKPLLPPLVARAQLGERTTIGTRVHFQGRPFTRIKSPTLGLLMDTTTELFPNGATSALISTQR